MIMNKNNYQEWPEPITRVQSLSNASPHMVPHQYIKPPHERPSNDSSLSNANHLNIPVIDLADLCSDVSCRRLDTIKQIFEACTQWGFFQVINHGVGRDSMDRAREVCSEFFRLPVKDKEVYANSPASYEGYGSRVGVEKGTILDWCDYYFLRLLPLCEKNHDKWPLLPPDFRKVIDEYGEQVIGLCSKLLKALSLGLGLDAECLQNAFGGQEMGASVRVNCYPKCPQPELTLGLSSHSDPGGLTVILSDDQFCGLQVRKDDAWITVNPIPHALVVNVGDQIQVLSNGICKSVEHRAIVNSEKERVSLAFFYNPNGDVPIKPLEELVMPNRPSRYSTMTYNEYSLLLRTNGLHGKNQIKSIEFDHVNVNS